MLLKKIFKKLSKLFVSNGTPLDIGSLLLKKFPHFEPPYSWLFIFILATLIKIRFCNSKFCSDFWGKNSGVTHAYGENAILVVSCMVHVKRHYKYCLNSK